jgi:hypothetical protein
MIGTSMCSIMKNSKLDLHIDWFESIIMLELLINREVGLWDLEQHHRSIIESYHYLFIVSLLKL